MNYPQNFDINPEFESLLGFKSEEEEIEHMAVMYSLRIMHEAERLCEAHQLRKKDLAAILKVSPAFVTQLNSGDKLINPKLIARLEKNFGLRLRTEFISLEATAPIAVGKEPDLYVAEPAPPPIIRSASE